MKKRILTLIILLGLPCYAVDMWIDVDLNDVILPVNLMPLSTDGTDIDAGVTYDEAGMDLVWNFVTSAGIYSQTVVDPCDGGAATDYDWVVQGNGMYTIQIPNTGGASINNDTEGTGWFTGETDATIPWRGPVIGFRAAALNDALIDGGDNLDTNLVKINNIATQLQMLMDATTTVAADGDLSGVVVTGSVKAHEMSAGADVTTAYNASESSLEALSDAMAELLVELATPVWTYR